MLKHRVVSKESYAKNSIKKIVMNPDCIGTHENTLAFLGVEKKLTLPSKVNSLSSSQGDLAIGLADGQVGLMQTTGHLNTIYQHKSNVCSIDFSHGKILSGSWDHTAILYEVGLGKVLNVFQHPESVWCTKIISPTEFITGCSDGSLRRFRDGKIVLEIKFFYNSVRGIVIKDEFIYMVDNEGKTLKVDFNGKILANRDLQELCFELDTFKDFIVAGGENGFVYFLTQDLELKEKKNHCYDFPFA